MTKYFQPENIDVLCSALVVTAETSCPQILAHATAISSKFKEVLNLFAKCHQGYNSNAVSDQAVDDLGNEKLHI